MKNEKMLYHTPELCVIRLEDKDFLDTSGEFPGEWDDLKK